MGRRTRFLVLAGALALAIASCGKKKGLLSYDEPVSMPPDYEYVNLEVGLTEAERAEIWHASEGSSLFPVDILKVLNDKTSGEPAIVAMRHYGFLPSEVSKANPYGLPVGWSTVVPENSPLGLPYAGLNCFACHTGQIEYNGRRLRIDGAPNMVDLEEWGLQLRDSVLATLDDPIEAFELLGRLVKLKLERGESVRAIQLTKKSARLMGRLGEKARKSGDVKNTVAWQIGHSMKTIFESDEATAEKEVESLLKRLEQDSRGLDRAERAEIGKLLRLFKAYAPLIKNRLGFAVRAVRAIEISPEAGPGRDDPWGIIRNLVFKTETPMTAPTSIPHLYFTGEVDWYHADGNTNSLLDRNIAQAIALGAYVDEATKVGVFLPKNIERLQVLAGKLEAPSWPADALGEIDEEQAKRGEELFRRKIDRVGSEMYSCLDCHASRKSQLYTLEVIQTDPNRARNFLRPMMGKPFAQAIPETIGPIRDATFKAAGLPPSNDPDDWRGTGKYVARQLDGVWSTAPYLHNGSVPTLYDLLLPASERPATFKLGHREYDPQDVGYARQSPAGGFDFNTDSDGNSNAGHEFGTGLSEIERRDLLEYLKTL